MGTEIFIGFTSFYHIPAVIILATAQFIPQFKLAWRLRHALDYTSISSWTLGSQAVILVLVAISWRIRLRKVRLGYASEWVVRGLYDWYMMIG
jgi:hypothetical protein